MVIPTYRRYTTDLLVSRLREGRGAMQIVLGPRHSGKTTSVRQALEELDLPHVYASADSPVPFGPEWVAQQWRAARRQGAPAILVLDEVQKAQGWSEQVKAEWDADTWAARDLRVVLLGSSPLLAGRGLTESLAGRFETVRSTRWTYAECREAFAWDLDTFLFHGGYPGAARYLGDHERWRAYILDAIVETTVSRDVLLLTRIDKPALLRRLFALGCEYSGQELSYRKMIGQLTDAGNTTTLAHYLDLLSGTGLVTGLQKHSSRPVQRRSSSPKLLAMNTALMTALSGARFEEARADSAFWGRIVESAVGAHLLAVAQREGGELRYWRDGPTEVDFVTAHGRAITAVEVKSGGGTSAGGTDYHGLEVFRSRFPGSDALLIGAGGTPLETFLGGTA
jgi:predicted AAA+ superfamily ATPase